MKANLGQFDDSRTTSGPPPSPRRSRTVDAEISTGYAGSGWGRPTTKIELQQAVNRLIRKAKPIERYNARETRAAIRSEVLREIGTIAGLVKNLPDPPPPEWQRPQRTSEARRVHGG